MDFKWNIKFKREGKFAESVIQSAYEQENTKDLLIIAGNNGVEVPCHSFVLKAQSPVFAAMLNSNNGMKESQSGQIVMANSGEDAVNLLIRYLYFFEIPAKDVSCKTSLELLVIAHQYEITDLVENLVLLIFSHQDDIWFQPSSCIGLYSFVSNLDTHSYISFAGLDKHILAVMSRMPRNRLECCERYQELSSSEKLKLEIGMDMMMRKIKS